MKLSETVEESVIGGIAWVFNRQLACGEAEGIVELRSAVTEIALSPYLGRAEARRFSAETAVAA